MFPPQVDAHPVIQKAFELPQVAATVTIVKPKLSDFPFEKSGEKHLLGDRYLL
jgi:hypothetical protein